MLASLLQTLLQFTKRVENNIYSKVWRTGTRLITCACHDLSTRGYFLDENNKLDSWPCLKYNSKSNKYFEDFRGEARRSLRRGPRAFSRQISGEYAITRNSGKASPRTLWPAVTAPNVFPWNTFSAIFWSISSDFSPIFMVACLNHGKFVKCTTNRTSTRGSKPVRFENSTCEKFACGDQLSSWNDCLNLGQIKFRLILSWMLRRRLQDYNPLVQAFGRCIG